MSAMEALINVTVGWGTALALQLTVFPLVGLHASPRQHAAVSCAFSALSFTCMYLLRRIFVRLV
ncbi:MULTISPECIES: hypothetical protein [Mameliella]|uniref:DUF7220 family protein n=1 Tax=Mameliella TaxID=1434019 RepID=UPI000B534F69|nr:MULTISPECIES: hypothetical protein [Mameliella]OWV55454.1 hypothetical protein CDZ98_19015 [Mameliella alba]